MTARIRRDFHTIRDMVVCGLKTENGRFVCGHPIECPYDATNFFVWCNPNQKLENVACRCEEHSKELKARSGPNGPYWRMARDRSKIVRWKEISLEEVIALEVHES